MSTVSTAGITPFTIDIPQSDLDDLQQRLERTRFAPDLPDPGWRYGVPTAYLRDLVTYWKDEYDWRAWEVKLNGYPQFTSEIDGETLHFLHIESAEPDATPLVLIHGWPGSILEFIHVIEPLTNPVAHGGKPEDAFHLVIPSLPGFGFSSPTHSAGWTSHRAALAVAELMRRLGYERYGAQGGDLGAFIAPELGKVDSGRVVGVHVNAATFGFTPWGEVSDDELESFIESERERLARLQHWTREGNGYFQVQATRPQTISAGLSDSPAGQLAWIVEKFKEWTFAPDSEEIPVDRDIILTDVMLYWLTNAASSSSRVYYEDMHAELWSPPSGVPLGVAVFAEDVAIRRYGEEAYNIVHWSEFDRGGHFAALEAPDLLVGDIRAFFATVRAQG